MQSEGLDARGNAMLGTRCIKGGLGGHECSAAWLADSAPRAHLFVGLDGEVVDVTIGPGLQALEQLALNGAVKAGSNLRLGLTTTLTLLSPGVCVGGGAGGTGTCSTNAFIHMHPDTCIPQQSP